MSKDLRFNKKDVSLSEDSVFTQSETNKKTHKYMQTDVKFRGRENFLRRSRKRICSDEDLS
jgi:hypothetical protein